MDRIFLAVVLVAVVFLSLLTGAAMLHFEFGMGEYLKGVFSSLEAEQVVDTKRSKKMLGLNAMGAMPRVPEDFGVPAVPEGWDPGVRFADPDAYQSGVTVYASMKPRSPVRLIDMQGNTVHEWQIPDLNTVTERLDGKTFPREINAHASDVHVYPDGRILMTLANDLGFPPIGYALVMLDRNSEVLWHYTKMTHHQVDVAEDGRIAAILNDEVRKQVSEIPHVKTPFREDQVVILSPDGEELDYISVLRAFLDSEWLGALKHVSLSPNVNDKFHANAAKFLTASQASAIPNAKQGDILLSLRNINMLAVLDPDKRVIVWAMTGPWLRQHDPHVLPNGNILLFDNHGNLQNPRLSRVLEVNPRTQEIVWEWPGARDFDMFTGVNGAVEPLENGNILIAETSRGRLIEVTPDGAVVWEYIVPERRMFTGKSGKGVLGTKVWHPHRLDPSAYDFLSEAAL